MAIGRCLVGGVNVGSRTRAGETARKVDGLLAGVSQPFPSFLPSFLRAQEPGWAKLCRAPTKKSGHINRAYGACNGNGDFKFEIGNFKWG